MKVILKKIIFFENFKRANSAKVIIVPIRIKTKQKKIVKQVGNIASTIKD